MNPYDFIKLNPMGFSKDLDTLRDNKHVFNQYFLYLVFNREGI